MQNININELRDKILTLPALEKKLILLKNECSKAEADVRQLLRNYERESRNVEQIQKESFSNFLRKLIGRYEDKLEKEQQEEIKAKLAYDAAVIHRDNLENDRREMVSRISDLRDDERRYQNELTSRRAKLSVNYREPDGVKFAQLEDETVSWCKTILQRSPMAIRMIKRGLNAELDGQRGLMEFAGDATLMYYLMEEAQEGKNAFLEKRDPDFQKFPKFP